MVFHKSKNIRFSHCDPAGIVFYPRYAELCNEVVEDWFREALAVDFNSLHETHRLGIPAVKLEVEYHAPSVYGEVLDYTLAVAELGNSSMVLTVNSQCRGQARVSIRLKVVLMDMDTRRPVPIDGLWREKFSRYQEAAARKETAA